MKEGCSAGSPGTLLVQSWETKGVLEHPPGYATEIHEIWSLKRDIPPLEVGRVVAIFHFPK